MDNGGAPVLAPKSNKGLIMWLSVMAGLSSFSSAAVLTDVVGIRGAGLFLAMVGSLQAATAVYVGAARPVESLQTPPTQGG